MTPDQCRMARAALAWGVRDLADAADVSKDTIARFENGIEIKEATVDKLRQAFEVAGLEFTPHNGVGEGVRWKQPPKKRKTAKGAKK